MGINFDSEEFRSLSKHEKQEIVLKEFEKCKDNFEYFINNYAYIRHPSVGILKVKFFDFQYDICIPISIALKYGRTEKTKEALKNYKFKYDYNKHIQYLCEYHLDTYEKIPPEFHEFYRKVYKNPDYNLYIDTIVLKSRQVGLSTAFQQLINWHINFYPTVYDLVLSQGDREAKKFVDDIQRSYELIPGHIRAEKVKMNDHELWLTLSGKDMKSGVQALPPTAKAGRSYSPNLVILDEFAFWQKPEETYTAISFALSGGGIMVIISTPNGVGNLYHKLWELSKKELSVYVHKNDSLTSDTKIGIFKPVVVHWSQIPEEEFIRRGFKRPIDWYNYMSNKLKVEGGDRKVAQELELDFITSGESLIPPKILKELRKKSIDKNDDIFYSDTIENLIIYEKPKKNSFYLLGVDVSEGVRKDYSVIYVIKIKENNKSIIPKIVAKYSSNTLSPKQFSKIVCDVGHLYNNAIINFEKNNPGLVLFSELIEREGYNENLILNRYNPTLNKFMNDKGWRTTKSSKEFMLSTLKSFIITYRKNLSLPISLLDEFLTFYQSGFHDDEVMAFSLALVGYQLLDKYNDFLIEKGITLFDTDNDVFSITSSTFKPKFSKEELEHGYLEKSKIKNINELEVLKSELENLKENKKIKDKAIKHRSLSKVIQNNWEDYDFVF